MTYEETIDFLYAKLPMFSRIGVAAIKANLTNTIKLCRFLGDPQNKFKTVHIAGTNGKGSVSHMLASIFQTAGYRTGLYTSPHLRDFRERIKVNGQVIPGDFVISFTEKIKPLIESIEPSFFEITVAMAFDYFASEKVDIAMIETGLGGRLDSTNIILPELSVITNIGWDHMNLLGNTLPEIAFEKAGIIKPGVPVVIGEVVPETIPVFAKAAAQNNASMSVASQTRETMNWQWIKHELEVEVASKHAVDHKLYQLDLPGIYQTKNLLTVLEASSQLVQRGWKLSEEAIRKGLRRAKKLTGLHGRWELIHHAPSIVLDVAHNVDGIAQLLEQIELTPHNHLHIILGMVKDKEIEKVLSLLPLQAIYYFTQASTPRAIAAGMLQEKAAVNGLRGNEYANVNQAIEKAKLLADKDDLIVVCGSVFLIGEVTSAS